MNELKARWVPCQYCGQRIKLFTDDAHWDTQYTWMHQPSDDQEPYLKCAHHSAWTVVQTTAKPTVNKPARNLV